METIDVQRSGGVVTVTLDRPHRKNAIDWTMWGELLLTFREIATRRDDRVVVVTGAAGSFCSGVDLLSGGEGGVLQYGLAEMRHVGDVFSALHRLDQPTIAKVRGAAVGGGCNLAFGCDLVAADESARFSQIFSRRGLSVDSGGSWLLPRMVGLHVAKELVLLADVVDARRAEELGLVNRVVPAEELDVLVDRWTARLVSADPDVLAMRKQAINTAHERAASGLSR